MDPNHLNGMTRMKLYLNAIFLFFLAVFAFIGSISSTFVDDNRNISSLRRTLKDQLAYPNFFVIGSKKSATSSLNHLLVTHPEICSEGEKEKHYFSADEWENKHGMSYKGPNKWQEYADLFKKCTKNQPDRYTVDNTPEYIFIEDVPSRIIETYGAKEILKKKFIVLFRDPMGRLYSEYQDSVRICLEHGNVVGYPGAKESTGYHLERGSKRCEVMCLNYKSGISYTSLKLIPLKEWINTKYGAIAVSRSYYKEQLVNWMKSGMSRKQLFIINFETLITNTTDTMHRLTGFLGLKSDWPGSDSKPGSLVVLPTTFQTKPPNTPLDCESYEFLEKYLRDRVGSYGNYDSFYNYINNDKYRPSQEPYFPPFTNIKSLCKDVEKI